MTQLLQVLVIAKLLLSRTHLCAHAENDPLPRVLYVTPHSNIPCPEIPCLTLSQYTLDQDTYFGNDTELCFLSGVHRLSNSIVIEGEINHTKLALVGEAFDPIGAAWE